MRWSALALGCALAACSRVASTGAPLPVDDDAGVVDAPRMYDAPPVAPPPDAYVPRACDAPPTFADGLVPARVLHVVPGATGGDGSAAAPFGTIAAAAAAATPGTFIKLAPGVHLGNQFVPDLRGTAEAPIWIGGEPGTRPVIEGGAEALHLTRPAYVVVQHLEVRKQTANGINIDDGVTRAGDAHHVALVDVRVRELWGVGKTCVRASAVDDLFVYDSRFLRCNGGLDQVGVHRAVIARNQFLTMGIYAVRARGGATDIDIRQNHIDSGGAGVMLGGVTALSQFSPPVSQLVPNAEARRVRAFNNVLVGDAIAPFSFVGCVDCLVAHNVSYGNTTSIVRILTGTVSRNGYVFEPTQRGRVINNSFVWQTLRLVAHVEASPGTLPETFTFSHNLWYSLDQPGQSTPSLPVPEAGSVIGERSGYLPFIPGYLCEGPEIGAAVELPEIDGTFEGHCRTEGDAPTIGPQAGKQRACIPF